MVRMMDVLIGRFITWFGMTGVIAGLFFIAFGKAGVIASRFLTTFGMTCGQLKKGGKQAGSSAASLLSN